MSRAEERQAEVLRLGTLEAQVMDVLWNHGPVTVRQVIDQLPSDPAYTTIATVLTNLDRKHLVTISRTGRSTRYAARLDRQEYAAQQIEQVLAASGDRTASILQFVASMPAADLELLRSYLQRHGEEPSP